MIVKLEFNIWNAEWSAMTPDQYEELRSVIPDLPEDKKDSYGAHVVDLEIVAPVLRSLNLEPKLLPMPNNMLVTLKDQVSKLASELKLTKAQMVLDGSLVQIHVPNIGLLAMNEVKVLSDSCTDALQGELDAGWSMLAVCPPNAQRRPDYILGRSNPSRSTK